MAKMSDVKVYDGLAVVTLEGFDSKEEQPYGLYGVDARGSANWFCERYGMAADLSDADTHHPGIIWTDYDSAYPWEFAVLIDLEEVEALLKLAAECDYVLIGNAPVTEPTNFGDGGGTVEILRHRDGWVVLGG